MYNWYNGMNPDITNFVVSLIIKTVVIVARFSDIVRKEVEQVLDYISVTGPVTRFWHPKHEGLADFLPFCHRTRACNRIVQTQMISPTMSKMTGK